MVDNDSQYSKQQFQRNICSSIFEYALAFCQIADERIGEPRFAKGDIIIMLSDRAIDRCEAYVSENSTGRETLFKFSFPQNGMKRVIKGSLHA